MSTIAEEPNYLLGFPFVPSNSSSKVRDRHSFSPDLRATKHIYRFRDDDGVRRGDPFAMKTWEGHMDVQYWEKAGGEVEGVWVFAAELAAPDDPKNVERCVWQRVKRLEGIVEDDSD